MSLIRVGSNSKFAEGWDSAFGSKKKAAAGKTGKVSKPAKASKKAAAASPKKAAKKKTKKK